MASSTAPLRRPKINPSDLRWRIDVSVKVTSADRGGGSSTSYKPLANCQGLPAGIESAQGFDTLLIGQDARVRLWWVHLRYTPALRRNHRITWSDGALQHTADILIDPLHDYQARTTVLEVREVF